MQCQTPLNDGGAGVVQVGGILNNTLRHKNNFARDLLIQTMEWIDDRKVSRNSGNFTVNIEGFEKSDF